MTVLPNSNLREYRPAGTLNPNSNDDQQKKRPEDQQQRGANHDIEHSFHLLTSPVEGQRRLHHRAKTGPGLDWGEPTSPLQLL